MLKRVTAFALALLLFFGMVWVNPTSVKAEGNEKTFTFADLKNKQTINFFK